MIADTRRNGPAALTMPTSGAVQGLGRPARRSKAFAAHHAGFPGARFRPCLRVVTRVSELSQILGVARLWAKPQPRRLTRER